MNSCGAKNSNLIPNAPENGDEECSTIPGSEDCPICKVCEVCEVCEDPEIEPPFTIVDIFDPCGNGRGTDEIVMQLSNDEFIICDLQSKEIDAEVREPGIYITNDDQECEYEITEDGEVLW